MTKLSLALAFSGVFSVALSAQDNVRPCSSNDLRGLERFHHNDPVELARIAAADQELEDITRDFVEDGSRGGSPYVIPVVFHIIHNNGPENISDEQVYDAIRVLNDDYNKLNADWVNVRPEFLDIVADVGIEFRLASKDPQGACTKGITRTVSTLTNDGTQTMKDLIQWPRNKYLNVWVAASADGAAGYTYRPGAVSNWPEADGIVLLHNYVGTTGTSSVSHSRTLTHEVGHWINLKHCWGDSNDPGLPENCGDDDSVTDTPNTIGWTSCNVLGASCGSPLDNVENYMEYSYCSKMFTVGQRTRMLAALGSNTAQRSTLWSSANLTATGVSTTPVLCAAEFTSTDHMVCSGVGITFTDQSYHGITSRTWEFPGGTPSTSSDATPTVTYAEPGIYPVTLTVSDGTTTLSTSTESYVTVYSNPGQTVPFIEGFENITALPVVEWIPVNENSDNTFAVTNAAAFTGAKSVRILNATSMAGRFDELLSSTYDMSGASDINISFRYAYAKRTSTSDDALRVYVSNNCGATWSLRKIMRGSNSLTTGGTTTSSFVPGLDQWGYAVVDNISSGYHTANFRIKFEFESDGGNNLYIDDINLAGMPVGLQEMMDAGTFPMLVVPNPVENEASVMFELDVPGRVQLDLLDVVGRRVQAIHEGMLPNGLQRISLPVDGLPGGIYMVRLTRDGGSAVTRFTVE
ncbi:MAG: M43 family zinc metalloprotease [Flavobacteriales bacterium]